MPVTLALAFNCVPLSAVPYVIGAGVVQVIVGVILPPTERVVEFDNPFRAAMIVAVPVALPVATP